MSFKMSFLGFLCHAFMSFVLNAPGCLLRATNSCSLNKTVLIFFEHNMETFFKTICGYVIDFILNIFYYTYHVN